MNTTKLMLESLEKLIIKKTESFNEKTSPEEIHALTELVRAVSICKKVNHTLPNIQKRM